MTRNPLDTSIFNVLLASTGVAPAGIQLNIASLANARDHLITIDITLDTTAVAGNRYFGLQMIDGIGSVLVVSSPFVQIANTVFRYIISIGAPFDHETNIDYISMPLPPKIFITNTVYLQTTVLNWDAGDRYLAMNVLYSRQANPL